MVKITYLGYEGSPLTTSTQGYDFKRGVPTEVTDDEAIEKLKKNPYFHVPADGETTPAPVDPALSSGEILKRHLEEQDALAKAQADAALGRIAEDAKTLGAALDEAAAKKEADQKAHAEEMARINRELQAKAAAEKAAAGVAEPPPTVLPSESAEPDGDPPPPPSETLARVAAAARRKTQKPDNGEA